MKLPILTFVLLLSVASARAQGDSPPAADAGDEAAVADHQKVARAYFELRTRVKKGDNPKKAAAEVLARLNEAEKKAFRDAIASGLKRALISRKQSTLVDPPDDGRPPAPQDAAFGNSLLSGVDQSWEEERPNDPEVFANSGADDFRMGNFRRSYDDYGRAIALGAGDPKTYLGYGEAAYRLGAYDAAARSARWVLSRDPKNQEALFLYHAAKDRPPSVTLPSTLGAWTADRPAASGGAFSVPQPSATTAERAAAPIRQASAPGPDAPARSAQFAKDAADALRAGDSPAAYRLSSRAVEVNPRNAQALNFRAMSLSQMRRYPEAVQDASAALELAPGNAAALHTRSWAFSKQGNYQAALRDARAASAAQPASAYLYQDEALALAGLGDRPGALDALRRSAALDPRFASRLERAVQLPRDADMTLLFDDGPAASAAAAAPAPSSRPRRFLRLAVLSLVGGLLIALGALHVVSASWREALRTTMRRALGPPRPRGSFWTQYEVIREIGLGGMGVVYEATDRSLERRVAVKKMRDEIRRDPQERRRFVDEARLVARLHHPSVVDIYAIVEDGLDVYLVFEFVAGRTLQDALKPGPLDFARARQIVREMADAVEHAHARGIIHRDLKPSNVMLTPEGKVKVMDFGIARQAKDALARRSMTNTVAGTPPYMAPEQEQGAVRKESDVYALGVCLYEMTTGGLPFAGSGAAMLLGKLGGKPVPACRLNSALPAGLDAVIARALEPDPDKRFRAPADLAAALDALAPA